MARIASSIALVAALAAPSAGAQTLPDPIYAAGFEAADLPATDGDAARFLTQASFGPTKVEIAHVRNVGYGGWIDEQLAAAPTLARPYLQGINVGGNQNARVDRWFNTAAVAPDQLRQRMAWALSQIMVLADQGSEDVAGFGEYWDVLARDGFGSYRTLLGDVSFSPQMGRYLSHFRNRKTEENSTLSPDENYAREVMQLFSIGLVFRNMDFSPILDDQDQEIPTYDQEVVKEMAQVFTGLANPCPNPPGGCSLYAGMFTVGGGFAPMACFPRYHDLSEKALFIPNPSGQELQRVRLPAGPSCPNAQPNATIVQQCIDYCMADVNGALDAIGGHAGAVPFDGHPNVPPFISRQLIERFVTSNPSPEYIQRIATVFHDTGGNLAQTLKALLLDVEARSASTDPASGKPREPLLKLTAMWRAWGVQMQPEGATGVPMGFNDTSNRVVAEDTFLQSPLRAPTVFNFYQPDYQQPGAIAAANLFSPELQIVDESSVAMTGNNLFQFSWTSYVGSPSQGQPERPYLDLGGLASLGGAAAMVDEANLRMLYGRMSLSMRQLLINLLNGPMAAATPTDKALAVVHLIAISPEYATQQ